MKEILKHKKLSVTTLRIEVLEIINASKNALAANEIGEKLEEFNRITLYRTLKSFISAGIIHEIAISGHDSKYAMCLEECSSESHQHQHIHFNCSECEKVFCVETRKMPSLSIPNFQIESVDIQAKGVCENCSSLIMKSRRRIKHQDNLS